MDKEIEFVKDRMSILSNHNNVSIGSLRANGYELETPALWLGQTFSHRIPLWDLFNVDGVIVSAYELLIKQSRLNSTKEKGINNFLKSQAENIHARPAAT